jgi:NADH-quinone oxidoreductase subunit N
MNSVPNFMPALPEIFLLAMGCIALLLGIFAKHRGASLAYWTVQLSLLITTGLVLLNFGKPAITFNNTFILDQFAVVLKTVIILITFMVFVYSRDYLKQRIPQYQVEYYVLGLFAVLGMMILVSAYSFITIFLGLELFSLPVYAMIAMQRDSEKCTEAAMKYFVVGAIATGMLLYGLSMLYGATRTLDVAMIAQTIATIPAQQQLILVFGLVFVLAGIAFKLGAVPFHMWVPDIYEGAPSVVTLFISAAPKVAALALAVRLLVDAMPALALQWQPILIVIAFLSMALGNIAAIVQSNIKRMLAYSSIAHMGYMTLGLLTATTAGYAAATFYSIAYVIMTGVAFGMIVLLSRAGFEAERIEDFQGLNNRSPWLAFVMLLVMFSMAGIPPLVGFMAKVAVLEALIRVHLVWLAVAALLFAIIGAYYYLKVVKVMYFEDAVDTSTITASTDVKVMISINALLVLFFGLFPGLLFNLCKGLF